MVPLVPSEIVEKWKHVKMLGKTAKIEFNQIEMDLERIILMVKKQENVVLVIPTVCHMPPARKEIKVIFDF